MKWFKHYTDALDDPFIQELILKFGSAGYLAYFGLIEIIGKENGNMITGKLEISPTFLKQKFHISQRKLEVIYDFCSRKGKVIFDKTLENWKFKMPKMLELKDNYTKDLQVSSKKLSIDKEIRDKKKNKEKERERERAPKPGKLTHGEFLNVMLTSTQFEKLIGSYGLPETDRQVEALSGYIASTGKRYKNHYATIQNWIKRDKGKQKNIHNDVPVLLNKNKPKNIDTTRVIDV